MHQQGVADSLVVVEGQVVGEVGAAEGQVMVYTAVVKQGVVVVIDIDREYVVAAWLADLR